MHDFLPIVTASAVYTYVFGPNSLFFHFAGSSTYVRNNSFIYGLQITIPRKVILEEEEDAEFGSLYREYQETGGRRIALDRHFYFFPWTSRYICWTDTSTSSLGHQGAYA